MYFTYLLRCGDGSLYCGYTTDIGKRMDQHKAGKGAKYVKAKGYKRLEFYISSASKSDAMKFEAHIKKLLKKEKEDLLKGQTRALDELGLDYEIGLIVE
ncbi:GIY-YIG nuclease family protein [Peptostreptococcus stomatis]|nr:GIY-YIG nuclease family protein [uncultured Peptostreptococcus sp.]